ncbi:hypothetical protein [Halobellus marinus]|uniref:hypothetical protein n=1 Tax=Halobellus TaxID=1073986 RepID=UPI0028ACA31D|nr:hypothetical protein [Halobellus sp. DFY28]
MVDTDLEHKFCLHPSEESDITQVEKSPVFQQGRWYNTNSDDGKITYSLSGKSITKDQYLCFDFLQLGENASVFELLFIDDSGNVLDKIPELVWGRSDERFIMNIRTLPECSARIRLPLADLEDHTVKKTREGAWLSSYLGGNKLAAENVEEIVIRIKEIRGEEATWCLSPLYISESEPPRETDPYLPQDKLLDKFGQSTTVESFETVSHENELTTLLQERAQTSDTQQWPNTYSKWGGWKAKQFEATGFFRTKHDGRRWWIIDPDGHPFWSSGVSAVHPVIESAYADLESGVEWIPDENGSFSDGRLDGGDNQDSSHSDNDEPIVNYLSTNFIRAFTDENWRSRWREIVIGDIYDIGFNTIGAWSDEKLTSETSQPYTRTLEYNFPGVPNVYSDFQDVYHPNFEAAVDEYARPLEKTSDDEQLIGYFLGNYPDWTVLERDIASEMVLSEGQCASQRKLAKKLREKYGSTEALSDSWGVEITFEQIARGSPLERLPEGAQDDLWEFSQDMVTRLIRTIDAKCNKYDQNHLNLGLRFADLPPEWAMEILENIDILTTYIYSTTVSEADSTVSLKKVAEEYNLPILIGEWQFGALESGVPSPGLSTTQTQEERSRAMRVYLEDAVSKPWCVGAHYFRWYDNSAIGGGHGENFNVGIFDTCHRRYRPVGEAFRETHERLYGVASGKYEKYDCQPEYL